MLSQLILQIILIAVNAIFAASEMAFVSINENKIKKQAAEGDRKAERVLSLTQEPTGMLSAIQICITLAGFLGSAFAADSFSEVLVRFLVDTVNITVVSEKVLDSISVIIITIILSYFTLVLGELVPKRIAMKKAESIAKGVSGILVFLVKVLKPVVWLLSASTNVVMKVFGIDPEEEEETPSEEDILILLDEGNRQGAIDSDAKEMIENVFELDNTNVGNMMVHRRDMTVIHLDDSMEDILSVIQESGFSRIPVVGNDPDDVVGILRTKEYLIRCRETEELDLSALVHSAKFVPQSLKANVLLREMQVSKDHMAIVIDEYGGVLGLVTLEDLLEEIVGNIYDETDEEETPEIEKTDDNTYIISGEADFSDVVKTLGIITDNNDESYSTFAGYIFSCIKTIPVDLKDIELHSDGMHISVISSEGRKITKAKVVLDGQKEDTE